MLRQAELITTTDSNLAYNQMLRRALYDRRGRTLNGWG